MKSVLGVQGILRITEHSFREILSPEKLVWAIQNGIARPLRVSNMVVDVGLDAIMAMLGGCQGSPTVGGTVMSPATTVDLAVKQMRITDQAAPTAPASTDVWLEGTPVWTGDVLGGGDSTLVVTYPGSGQVKFSTLIPGPDLDGITLTEEGLFTYNDKLVARTTFNKPKTTAFALQLDHTITLTRA